MGGISTQLAEQGEYGNSNGFLNVLNSPIGPLGATDL
jgi:hypothetical protein